MPFPSDVPTRVVTVGGAMVLESSDLLRVAVTITASKSLVREATGYRFERLSVEQTSEAGTEVSFSLPRTDVAGWKDAATNQIIDVSAPDSYTHKYTATVRFLNADGRSLPVKAVTLGPFVLPEGDGTPVDLDKTVPSSTVAGEVVSIPDLWSAQVAEALALVQENQVSADAAIAATEDAEAAAVLALDAATRAEAVPADVDTAMAAQASDPASEFSTVLTTKIGAALSGIGHVFSANAEGADPAAAWQTNRAAIQAANDKAAAAGGGRVTLEPGVYEVKGIIRDTRVFFDLPGVTLKSPDGTVPNLITSRLTHRTGTAVKGSNQVTVNDATGIEVGSRVAVFAAGGILDSQETRLTGNINATTTSLALANVTGLADAGTLLVDDELISFTGRSGGSLTGVARGVYGTTAAAHTTAASISVARRLYATVRAVAGNTLTLDRSAVAGGVGVPVSFGVVGGGVIGFPTLDGNKPPAGAASSVFTYLGQLEAWATYDLRIVNGETGGFMLARGSAYNRGIRVHLHDSSVPAASKGSAFWLYQGCEHNVFDQIEVTGHSWVAVYLDDRTSINEEGWDAPNRYNTFHTVNVDVSEAMTGVVNVVSGQYNRFLGGRLKSPKVGINCSNNSQGAAPGAGSTGNVFEAFAIDTETPWTLYASGNSMADIFVERMLLDPINGNNHVDRIALGAGLSPVVAPQLRTNRLKRTKLGTWAGWDIPAGAGAGADGGVIDLSSAVTTFNPIVNNTDPVPATPGKTWAGSYSVSVPVGKPAVALAAVLIAYRASGGAWAATGSRVGQIVTINPGETKQLPVTLPVTPALTEGMRLQIQMRSTAAAGRQIIVSAPTLEADQFKVDAGFNGDSPGGMWAGTPGESESILFHGLSAPLSPGVTPEPEPTIRTNILSYSRLDTWAGWTVPTASGAGADGGVIDLSSAVTSPAPLAYNTAVIEVGAGVQLAAALDVEVPAGKPAIELSLALVGYKDLAASTLSSSGVGVPFVKINPGETKRVPVAWVTAPDTVCVRVQLQMRSTAAAGRQIVVKPAPTLESGVTSVVSLFNGDTAGAVWTAAPGASPSTMEV